MTKKDLFYEPYPGWLQEAVPTEEASRITGIPVATLTTMRSRGGGPRHIRPKGTRIVRYFRYELLNWLTSGGIKSSTATPDPDDQLEFIDESELGDNR